ncbi:MAG: DUF3750 domain-containing protein [Proteobacteria bacterium]|nr:DUF3750 domain-containing protein [Pseudomonadota bacterium]
MVAVMVLFAPNKYGAKAQGWRNASHASAGIAPDPATTPEAVVQVYGARAWGWRGYFGVHTWLAVKPSNAAQFTVYEVIGWRLRWGDSAVVVHQREPDGRWFGSEPELLTDLRGEGVDDIIRRIDLAARRYPYAQEYTVWPGPNSNTFTAFVAREVPELKLDLPPTAIGKDYLGGQIVAATPSGTGFQFSLMGLFGFMAGAEEGVEFNILGLTFGLDPLDPAIKLPLVGRIGPTRVPKAVPEQAAVPNAENLSEQQFK